MTKMAHQQSTVSGHKMSQANPQIELLTPKQNGTAVDVRGEGAGSSGKSIKGTSIRGMWKKAFKSLQKGKPKGDKGGEAAEGRDKDDKADSSDERRQYSRMTSRQSQSSLKKMLKRKDSKEKEGSESEDIPHPLGSEDSVFSTLKYASQMRSLSVSSGTSPSHDGHQLYDNLHEHGEPMVVKPGSSHPPHN